MKPLFTSAQWALIDLGNQYGLDKKFYWQRLKWAKKLLPSIRMCKGLVDLTSCFESLIKKADEPELFTAALLNVWDITQGRPSGHYVELDTPSSGCQLLSVATRCITGMRNTGAIGDVPPDLYTTIYKLMLDEGATISLERKQVKKATVPYIYGSSAMPRLVFGDLADLFKRGYYKAVPRAEIIKNLLIAAWNNEATFYEWELPDGHTAHIKVIRETGEVFYYSGQRFTYRYKEVGTKEAGEEGTKALAARVTHSLGNLAY